MIQPRISIIPLCEQLSRSVPFPPRRPLFLRAKSLYLRDLIGFLFGLESARILVFLSRSTGSIICCRNLILSIRCFLALNLIRNVYWLVLDARAKLIRCKSGLREAHLRLPDLISQSSAGSCLLSATIGMPLITLPRDSSASHLILANLLLL